MRWIGAGFPDYPWLFGTDGEPTPATRSWRSGSSSPLKDHMRALRDISELLNDGSGVVVHEVVPDGSIWHGKDLRGTNPTTGEPEYDFNTDEIVKFPSTVALIWRWTGDDAFRDEMLDFTRRNLEYVRTRLDADGDGWPEGNGNVERPGMGEEKLDNAVYYIRGLYDYADMADGAGPGGAGRRRPGARRRRWPPASRPSGGSRPSSSTPTRCAIPATSRSTRSTGSAWTPMEAELYRDGEFVPGLASYANGSRALATRENSCYSGERPGNRGLFHTGCGGGPTGAGEFGIFSLNTAVQAVGEGNYGAPRRRAAAPLPGRERRDAARPARSPAARRTSSPARCRRSCPRSTPDGAVGTPPNLDRCWTCRSMFMQAWGHYGTAWPVIHQQLGVRPHLGRDRLEIVPQLPDGQASVEAREHPPGPRLGRRARHARRDPLHDRPPTRATRRWRRC